MRVVLSLVVLLSGCPVPESPGELVGTYSFLGTLAEHTCGTFAIPDETPLRLVAEIRAEPDGLAYWQVPGGSRVVGTRLNGRFRFRTSQELTWLDPEPSIGFQGCSVIREDIIVLDEDTDGDDKAEASSDAGVESDADAGVSSASALTGLNTVAFSPMPGFNCAPALIDQGGVFNALPCRVEYELVSASIQDDSAAP